MRFPGCRPRADSPWSVWWIYWVQSWSAECAATTFATARKEFSGFWMPYGFRLWDIIPSASVTNPMISLFSLLRDKFISNQNKDGALRSIMRIAWRRPIDMLEGHSNWDQCCGSISSKTTKIKFLHINERSICKIWHLHSQFYVTGLC